MQDNFSEENIKDALLDYFLNLSDDTSFYEYCLKKIELMPDFIASQLKYNMSVGLKNLIHLMQLALDGNISSQVIEDVVNHVELYNSDEVYEEVFEIQNRFDSLLTFKNDPESITDQDLILELEDVDDYDYLSSGAPMIA